MKTVEFRIEGMTCEHCLKTVKGVLTENGAEATVDIRTGNAKAIFDETKVDFDQIRQGIEEQGYRVNVQ